MEECTKEETGVGAAIAAGSHEENGSCALLVIAPRKRRQGAANPPEIDNESLKNLPLSHRNTKQSSRATSPSRFV